MAAIENKANQLNVALEKLNKAEEKLNEAGEKLKRLDEVKALMRKLNSDDLKEEKPENRKLYKDS
ncbi:12496_t:CDS:2, partial [Funneliformis geosporum]